MGHREAATPRNAQVVHSSEPFMATISYDGQSIILDGRRIWLISGTIHYARTPRELWRDRIRAAKQAGLNCIDTFVFWDLHEPQPGVFRFDGDYDLRQFVHMLASEGMHCILRPGPYIGGGWDMGGLPAWLHDIEGIQFRQASPKYLQACARYIDAVMKQVGDLQVSGSKGGPIVMVQNEHKWYCHNDHHGEEYLDELSRYLRESGCAVPITNCNKLWQHVTGSIDTWAGWDHLFVNSRQLHVAQPDAPRFISELWTGGFDCWGREHQSIKPAGDLMVRMARISAGGGQFNLYPFHGGTNFGFHAGRTTGGDDRFITTSNDGDGPLTEYGQRTAKYTVVKRIATFLNQFSALMANLKSDEHHAVAHMSLSVIQQSGSQGSVVFIVRNDHDAPTTTQVVTPDGQMLPIDLGDETAAWIVLNANLDGVAMLDLTSLRPWAFVDRRMLVLFGPAGSSGLVSIDGTTIPVEVPTGHEPLIFHEDPVTVVICSTAQIDAAYVHGKQLYVGIGGFDADDAPLRHDAYGSYHVIESDGTVRRKRHKPLAKPSPAPRLGKWQYASTDSYVDGVAPRYAGLNGPRSLERCGADFGYGWYRIRLKRSRAKNVKLMIPQGGDRLHLYLDGKFKAVLGHGEGAKPGPIPLPFPAGESELVVLADNLGRFDRGLGIGQQHGIYGHLLDVKPLAVSKAAESLEPRIDPFELSGYVPFCRKGDRSQHYRYTFAVNLKGKQPVVLQLTGARPRSVVVVNGKPVELDDADGVTFTCTLHDHLKKGTNRLTLALLEEAPDGFDPRKHVQLYEVVEELTAEAKWWYARWQMPDESAFIDLPSQTSARPAWFRSVFHVKDTDRPLTLEIGGASKGQIYINGRNAGRYFHATATGRKVPPQTRYYLPEPWLNTEGANELILFDEHGKAPKRCRLVYDDGKGPFGG